MGPHEQRAAAFAMRFDERLCTRIERWRWGTLFLNDAFLEVPDTNFLSVEDAPDKGFNELVVEAERVLRSSAIRHGRVVAVAATAEPLLAAFGAAGWHAQRYRLMVQRRRAALPATSVAVEEVGLADYLRFRAELDRDGPNEVRDAFAEEVDRRIGTRCFLASIDGVRASACVCWAHEADAQLDGVATLPAFRRRGGASAVTAAAAEAARASGASWIHLYTRAGTGPLGLYRRLGFEDAGEIIEFEADRSPPS